jgi:hypothetical protein
MASRVPPYNTPMLTTPPRSHSGAAVMVAMAQGDGLMRRGRHRAGKCAGKPCGSYVGPRSRTGFGRGFKVIAILSATRRLIPRLLQCQGAAKSAEHRTREC